MTKTYQGIWCMNQVVCPKCLVKPENIHNYGTDQQGFWFKARCPHCSNMIKWYRKPDLSAGKASAAPGVQMTLFGEGGKKPPVDRRKKGKRMGKK